MKSDQGGKIVVKIDNATFIVNTLDDYNGFLWHKLELYLNSGKHEITIINVKGFNAISVIAILPRKIYIKYYYETLKLLDTKLVINLNINLVKNSSFENGIDGWNVDENVNRSGLFRVTLDNSSAFEGNFALRVATNYTKTHYGWSWIRSDWINVSKGDIYLVITHMKAENVNSSHIVIEAYDNKSNRIFQLAQIPSAQYGTFDWQIYKYKLNIPENVTKIRIVLNAGWSNRNGTWAITWFDSIKLIPLKSRYLSEDIIHLLKSYAKQREQIKYYKINPTLWKIQVNVTKPTMLIFTERYDLGWEAHIYRDGILIEKLKPIPVFGVVNGFWIDKVGNLTIVIRYVPQEWFELGFKISVFAYAFCVFYFVWDWKKVKDDKRALVMPNTFVCICTRCWVHLKEAVQRILRILCRIPMSSYH